MLKETLKKEEIAAMKARDKAKVSILRLVNSDIKSFEVNEREEITDAGVIKIIEKQIKQQKETLQYAEQLNNADKISECKFAIDLLAPFLPAQLSEDEVVSMINEIITAGNYGPADMGKIMKEIMPKVAGKFDRSKINPLVKSVLS